MKIYLIISIDTECDKGPQWLLQEPMSFINITDALAKTLTPLFNKYGIKPTYLLSPEVIQHNLSVATFKQMDNIELGTHLHIEFIEPNAVWNANTTKGIQADIDPQIEFAKLQNLTELFRNQFGYQPLSFRAGRFGISKHTFSFLEKLNYKVDSSITPFKTHYYESGTINNFWGERFWPHTINKTKLLQVPVSLINKDFSKVPRFILRRLQDKKTVLKKVFHKLGIVSATSWFRPYKESGLELIQTAELIIKSTPQNITPVLNMMFHSNEILAKASPYCQTEDDVQYYLQSMDEVFNHLFTHYEVCSIGLGEYSGTLK